METLIQGSILAIVTTDQTKVIPGGAPVFIAKDEEEQEKLSLYLARVLDSMAHDLENGVHVIVRH
ncbi:MAG: capping complex subunit for YIEGIA [Bacillota bacterium]